MIIDGLGTISRLVGILFAVTYGVPRAGRLVFAAMPLGAWAYVAWAVVSLVWAYDANTAWGQVLTLFQLMLIAVLVADLVVQRPTVVRPLLWAYSVSAATTALIGIGSFVTSGSVDVRAAAIESQSPAQFAAVLLPAAVFGLYEVINDRQRLLGGAIAMLTIAGVVVSGTRSAWLALAVVAGLLVIPRLQPRRQIAAIATIVVVLSLTLQLPGVASLVDERAATATSSGGAGRTDIWAVGVTIYWTAPVVGVGYANFPVAYTDDAISASDVANSTARREGRGPHNFSRRHTGRARRDRSSAARELYASPRAASWMGSGGGDGTGCPGRAPYSGAVPGHPLQPQAGVAHHRVRSRSPVPCKAPPDGADRPERVERRWTPRVTHAAWVTPRFP